MDNDALKALAEEALVTGNDVVPSEVPTPAAANPITAPTNPYAYLSKKQISDRFDDTRKMAWMSFWCIVILTIVLLTGLIPIDMITALTMIINWAYTMFGGIVAAHIGFSAVFNK